MNLKISVFLILLNVFPAQFIAQINQEWVVRYSSQGNNHDEGDLIAFDNIGNIYVSGASVENSIEGITTLKYTSSGSLIWKIHNNGVPSYLSYPNSMVIDRFGNIYLLESFHSNCLTLKYDSAGNQIWAKTISNAGGSTLKIDSSGNIYINGVVSNCLLTAKYNPNGDTLWVKRYRGPGNSFASGVNMVLDRYGNIYVTGVCNVTGDDIVTIKYDNSGVQQWVNIYHGPGNYPYAIIVNDSMNVYVAGITAVNSNPGGDCLLIKYDQGGNRQWIQTYNGPGNGGDAFVSLNAGKSGNLYAVGDLYVNSNTDVILVAKYNPSGDSIWTKIYAGPNGGSVVPFASIVDDSGKIFITGTTDGNGYAPYPDYLTLSYDSLGILKWEKTYNGPGNGTDRGYNICIDKNGNIYVTGESVGVGTSFDFATIKYSYLDGINKISAETPQHYSLSQNYPNPFNPETKIKFAIAKNSFIKITVFDVLGRTVATLVNEQLQPGTYETDWDATDFTSGVYFYRLTAGNFSETKKLVLIK